MIVQVIIYEQFTGDMSGEGGIRTRAVLKIKDLHHEKLLNVGTFGTI